MAESVDALVSNTSGAIRAGSTPALGTEVKHLKGHAEDLNNRYPSQQAKCPESN